MHNRYEPAVPRMALRLAAAAMTAVTMWALVALPAKLEAADVPRSELAHDPAGAGPGVPGANCATTVGKEFLRTLLSADGTHAVDAQACPTHVRAHRIMT